jgi:branched-chain amino acid transport system substrate-binding protein
MKKKTLICALFCVSLFLVFSQTSWVRGAQTSKAPDAIKIGVCFSITGKFAGFYSVMGEWENALEAVINEKGGIYVKDYGKKLPVKVTWYDDKSDPPTTMKFYERLITVDKVDFLIGPTASPPAMSASTLADKYKIPMILTSSTDPKIYARGLKWITCSLETGLPWVRPYLEMLKQQTDAKKIALLTEDTIWPLGIREGAVEIIKQMGFDLVYDKLAPADTKDFSSVLVELKRINPDVIYVPAFGPFFTTFVKQLHSQQVKPKALHGTAGVSTGFVQAMGKEGSNYVTGDNYWVPGLKNEGWETLEEISKRSKINLMEWCFGPAPNFASHQVLFKAIESAGTLDREKVQKVLETATFKIIGGPWHRQPNGVGTYNPYPIQNVNGEFYAVYPPDVAAKKFIYPMP